MSWFQWEGVKLIPRSPPCKMLFSPLFAVVLRTKKARQCGRLHRSKWERANKAIETESAMKEKRRASERTDVLQYYVNSAWLKIKFSSPFSWRTKRRRKPVDGGGISSFVGQNFRRITKVFSFPFSALLYRGWVGCLVYGIPLSPPTAPLLALIIHYLEGSQSS